MSKQSTRTESRKKNIRASDIIDIDELHELLDMTNEAPKFHLLTVIKFSWSYVLALSACAEFFSFVTPLFFNDEKQQEVAPKRKFGFLMFWKKDDQIELVIEQCVGGVKCMFQNSLHWLEDHQDLLGVIFCAMWFFESFRRSLEARRKIHNEVEYSRLQRTNNKEVSNDELVENFSPWIAFASTLFLALSLLPLSFFFLAWNKIGLEPSENDTVKDSILLFNLEKKYSLFYAVFSNASASGAAIAKATMKSKIVKAVKKFSKKVMKKAVRNPIKFRRDVQKAMTVLRWIKYLAPLIGAGNKFLGNTKDLLKKLKQKHEAQVCRKIRDRLWKKMSQEEREVRAAIVIQTCYRGLKMRKARHSLELLKGNVEALAIQKIQKRLVEKARQARIRVMKQKEELRKLQQMQQKEDDIFSDGSAKHMTDAEKKRMYDLQVSLRNEALSQKAKKMLLRPDTKFSVTWKFLFVFCVFVEMTKLALKPRLEKYKSEVTKKPLDLESILEKNLVPAPIPTWGACLPLYTEEEESETFFKQLFGNKKEEESVEHEFPWYCYDPAVTVQSWYIKTLKFFINNIIWIIGVIGFLDVFVTFFTGEIHPKNGTLVPKPFFPRWILPGLVLQLLVNPKMAEVSVMVKKIMNGVHYVGPARALRWGLALFFPLINTFACWFEWNIWMKFVKEENKHRV